MNDRVKISVFLTPQLHREAKIAAIQEGVALSHYVAELVRKEVLRMNPLKKSS